ncbi:hypothetical protein HDK64DRAFT_39099 [Phyllosticta capitalensis]|uniref:Secreted protein n=1 Tax=Phyllosticta capitalensis TaxID=121624 RepID=A0ABR1YDF5_9PEZI
MAWRKKSHFHARRLGALAATVRSSLWSGLIIPFGTWQLAAGTHRLLTWRPPLSFVHTHSFLSSNFHPFALSPSTNTVFCLCALLVRLLGLLLGRQTEPQGPHACTFVHEYPAPVCVSVYITVHLVGHVDHAAPSGFPVASRPTGSAPALPSCPLSACTCTVEPVPCHSVP